MVLEICELKANPIRCRMRTCYRKVLFVTEKHSLCKSSRLNKEIVILSQTARVQRYQHSTPCAFVRSLDGMLEMPAGSAVSTDDEIFILNDLLVLVRLGCPF
eukprot:c31175_g1_i1 orf=168-473(+)